MPGHALRALRLAGLGSGALFLACAFQTAPQPGGLTLPAGFRATLVADGIGNGGQARHLVVRDNGDIYVAIRSRSKADRNAVGGSGTIALRDSDGDGKADVIRGFGDFGGTGIALRDGYLYRSSDSAVDSAVYRYKLEDGELAPKAPPETVVANFPIQLHGSHAAKSLAFDDAGHLYVNVGAPSNACQLSYRAGSPGQAPCPLLEKHGGIWRFALDAGEQRADEGVRYASGIRNAAALAWNRAGGALYLVQHGRDGLSLFWPEHYTDEDNAELPAEEFLVVPEPGTVFGWPYTYYDPRRGARMVAPEYGGDGKTEAEPGRYPDPLIAFPGHWAPNALLFYTGDMFPAAYKDGAFIAFHGSWNRAPLPQGGYKVVFVPMAGGKPAGDWRVFADGFAGSQPLESPGDAKARPTGLAQGADGALYISDSVKGRIWRIDYVGE